MSRTFILATLVLRLAAPGLLAQEPAQPTAPVVVTKGQATIIAVPDRAFVTIATESRSKNSADAQRLNADAAAAVLQRLQQAGIGRDALRTVGYDLQPEFDYANGHQTLRGYVARNTLEARVDAVDRVGAVLDAAGSGGATSIGGVRFDVKNRETIERDALRQAVADARARADAAAAGAGRTIDRVVRIEEDRAPEVVRPVMRMAVAESVSSTPIVPSTVEITARVTLTAALR
ncbi:MAG TPA: SIMPL domain-containing protein [Vicinamibacterales bacterium]|jgi:hypothetical protein|nr:SIMPL domain-containing protein [Vicinamibacterales bacterium]